MGDSRCSFSISQSVCQWSTMKRWILYFDSFKKNEGSFQATHPASSIWGRRNRGCTGLGSQTSITIDKNGKHRGGMCACERKIERKGERDKREERENEQTYPPSNNRSSVP